MSLMLVSVMWLASVVMTQALLKHKIAGQGNKTICSQAMQFKVGLMRV